ncbi:MAG: hypothetical protein L0216_15915 [Planctomycetales bacterium]|nr:hypothetical protein [Planctomycetales bacterium]
MTARITFGNVIRQLFSRFPEVEEWCVAGSYGGWREGTFVVFLQDQYAVFFGFATYLARVLAEGNSAPRPQREYIGFLEEILATGDKELHDLLRIEICETFAEKAGWVEAARKWFPPKLRNHLEHLFYSGQFRDATGAVRPKRKPRR